MMTADSLEVQDADIAVAKLVQPSLSRDITLAWREGRRHAPAAAEFLELSSEIFSQGQRGLQALSVGQR